jgi:hypothetical protein
MNQGEGYGKEWRDTRPVGSGCVNFLMRVVDR